MYPEHHEGVELRLVWEDFPNGEYNALHCTWPVPEMSWLHGDKGKMSHEAAALQSRLKTIPGIVEVSSHRRYQIYIQKDYAFSFADIRPRVEVVVREFFDAQSVVIEAASA